MALDADRLTLLRGGLAPHADAGRQAGGATQRHRPPTRDPRLERGSLAYDGRWLARRRPLAGAQRVAVLGRGTDGQSEDAEDAGRERAGPAREQLPPRPRRIGRRSPRRTATRRPGNSPGRPQRAGAAETSPAAPPSPALATRRPRCKTTWSAPGRPAARGCRWLPPTRRSPPRAP